MTLFGAVSLAATLGMVVGPWAGGWLYDALGSYAWMFTGSSASASPWRSCSRSDRRRRWKRRC
jgi:MFS family permease